VIGQFEGTREQLGEQSQRCACVVFRIEGPSSVSFVLA